MFIYTIIQLLLIAWANSQSTTDSATTMHSSPLTQPQPSSQTLLSTQSPVSSSAPVQTSSAIVLTSIVLNSSTAHQTSSPQSSISSASSSTPPPQTSSVAQTTTTPTTTTPQQTTTSSSTTPTQTSTSSRPTTTPIRTIPVNGNATLTTITKVIDTTVVATKLALTRLDLKNLCTLRQIARRKRGIIGGIDVSGVNQTMINILENVYPGSVISSTWSQSNGNLTMDASMTITESIPASTITSYVFDQATALSNIQYSIAAYKGYLDAATPANALLTVDTSKITTSATTFLQNTSGSGSPDRLRVSMSHLGGLSVLFICLIRL